jgi:dolichyl-phosphate beta-glucosyltransferase
LRLTDRFSVVVPAFNEAARIGASLDELRRWLMDHAADWELRVVDDGSEDETAAIVERAALKDPRIVAQREPHRGKGGAVKAGMLASTGARRFMCDADLSMPLHELPRFLAVVPSACDIAIGSREGIGARRVGEPAYRHLMGRAFNTLVRAAVLPRTLDSQCGFKLFTARAAEAIFPRLTIEGWAFDVEMMVVADVQGWQVRDVPIEWRYEERSQVSPLRDPAVMFRDVWRIRRNRRAGIYDK